LAVERGIDALDVLLYSAQTFQGTPMRWLPLLAILVLPACKPDLLPGTNVEDTASNRAVIEFLTRYHHALTERSPDAVVALCAPDYFEDNGTMTPADDYGIDGLRTRLQEGFKQTKELALDITVQKVEREKDLVKVSYRFKQRALVTFPSGDKWLSNTDVNRLVLRSDAGADTTDPGSFHILSGL
jgi:hypothetical protein